MSTASAISQSTLSIEALLGGRRVLQVKQRSALDWVSVIRQGLSSAAVDSLAKTLRVTQSELAAALGIPERTLARRKKEGTLNSEESAKLVRLARGVGKAQERFEMNSEESAKLVRLARVVGRAKETFEDLDIALDWLKSPNAALAGATPLSLLDTDVGAEGVMDTLGRIEHGVF